MRSLLYLSLATLLPAQPPACTLTPVTPNTQGANAVYHQPTDSVLYPDLNGGISSARPNESPRLIAGGRAHLGDPDGQQALDLFLSSPIIIEGTHDRPFIISRGTGESWFLNADGTAETLKTASGYRYLVPRDSLLRTHLFDAGGNFYTHTPRRLTTPSLSNPQPTPEASIYTIAAGTGVETSFPFTYFSPRGNLRMEPPILTAKRLPTVFVEPFEPTTRPPWKNFTVELTPTGFANTGPPYNDLGFTSQVEWQELTYTIYSGRLLRGLPGKLEHIQIPTDQKPFHLLTTPSGLLVRLADSIYYRLDNPNACPADPQPTLTPAGIVNAASYLYPETLAPGQLITVFGTNLDRSTFELAGLGETHRANIVYANSTQATLQTPVKPFVYLRLNWQGILISYPNYFAILPAAPGIFNATSLSGAPGEQLTLFATGLGLTPNALQARLGNTPLTVLSSEAAPEFPAGVYQITLQIPPTVAPGTYPLTLQVAGQSTTITLPIRLP